MKPAIILFALCTITLTFIPGCSRKSSLHPVLQEYLQSPDNHPLIPNCSYAGYHAGEIPLPGDFVTEGATVANVKDFGAVGDGEHDDTQAILKALHSDKKHVYFPEGEYLMTDMIRITQSNKILFGVSPEKSRIHFKKSLSDILGPFMKANENYNRWSNHGGLIWIAPGDIWDSGGGYIYQLPGPEGHDIGWINRQFVGSVCCPAERGEDEIKVKLESPETEIESSGLWILEWHETEDYSFAKYLGGHPAYEKYNDWQSAERLKRDWNWCVNLLKKEQKNDTVTLKLSQPIRTDILEKWEVKLYKPVGETPYIEEVGISNISLEMEDHRDFIHHLDTGYNGIFFQRSYNCWVDNVTIIDADNSIVLESCKNMTVSDVTLEGRTKRHHGFYFRYNVHDCMLSGFYVGKVGNEALSIAYRSSGNVFRDGTLVHGRFDSHRGLPFDMIRTNIHIVHNDGHSGGGAMAGPRNGARVVHWNVKVDSDVSAEVYQQLQHSSSVLSGIQGVEIDSTYLDMPPGDKGTEIIYHNKIPVPEDLYRFQLHNRLN